MSAGVSRVEVTRGDVVESMHRVHVVVSGADGVHFLSGDAGIATVTRSAVKSIQAQPLIDDGVLDAFGWGDRELALACASHSGEPEHVALAARMLQSIGLDESALACGAHVPYNEDAARALREAGAEPGRVHNNCSGKHAGMLALAKRHGWPTEGYHEATHPVQQRLLREMSRWTGLDESRIGTGVDGCGVVTYAVPLASLAKAFARLAVAASEGQPGPAAIARATTSHAHLVGGTGRMCTVVMQVLAPRVFVKVGAEGVYCAGVPDAGIGIALKVEDGSTRASEPALLEVLRLLGILSGQEDVLGRYRSADVKNTRGEVVGHVRARIELEKSR